MKRIFYKYVLPYLIFLFIYLLGKTLRVQTINREVEDKLQKEGRAIIYTFWHGRQLYIPYIYKSSKKKGAILTSPSKDGEIAAKTLQLFGFSIVRGSSFKKGGSALLKLVRTVKKDFSVALVGDGSRGPCYKMQKGIVNLAYLTGAPVLPMTYGAKNKFELKTWDRFIIPVPFSKIRVMYADPVYVDKESGEKELLSALAELENKMRKITETVDNWD